MFSLSHYWRYFVKYQISLEAHYCFSRGLFLDKFFQKNTAAKINLSGKRYGIFFFWNIREPLKLLERRFFRRPGETFTVLFYIHLRGCKAKLDSLRSIGKA